MIQGVQDTENGEGSSLDSCWEELVLLPSLQWWAVGAVMATSSETETQGMEQRLTGGEGTVWSQGPLPVIKDM